MSPPPGRTTAGARPRRSALLAILILSSLPSLLVFSDRWLGNHVITDLLTPLWCRLPHACFGPWPATMPLIIPAVLGAVILVARRPASRILLGPTLPEESQVAARPGRLQRRTAMVGLISFGLAMTAAVVSRSAAGERPAWDYALPYLGFLAA